MLDIISIAETWRRERPGPASQRLVAVVDGEFRRNHAEVAASRPSDLGRTASRFSADPRAMALETQRYDRDIEISRRSSGVRVHDDR